MKKSILKNLLALTFALGALVFVAGNVYADEGVPPPDIFVEDEIEDDGFLTGCSIPRCGLGTVGSMTYRYCVAFPLRTIGADLDGIGQPQMLSDVSINCESLEAFLRVTKIFVTLFSSNCNFCFY